MERLYIALKKQLHTDSVYNESTKKWEYTYTEVEPLGFGCASNKTGSFKDERLKKQRDWAYGAHEIINGEVWTLEREWDYSLNRWSTNVTKQAAKHQPLIIENEPKSGFKVEKIATRWSTANKLFRISDPRGFELEITAQNLLELMNSCMIAKGEILGKCKWDFGKNGIGKAKLIWVSN